MSTSKPIGIGFVGLSTSGWAASAIGGPLVKHPAYKLVAVSTSSATSAAASAKKWTSTISELSSSPTSVVPVKAYHGSTAHVAQDADVEAVAIAVKTPMHKELLTPVLEAGKHFSIEWPAGRNIEETREFARIAKEKGLKSIVPLQGRHGVAVTKVKEILKSGKIGKILSTSMICLSPRERNHWAPEVNEHDLYTMDPANGATFIDIQFGHHLDTFTSVLGDFTSVTATAAQLYPTAIVPSSGGGPDKVIPNKAPDHISVSGTLHSGTFVNMVWRTGYPSTPGRQQFIWEIDGTEGSIRLTDDKNSAAYLHLMDPKIYLNGELVEAEGGGTEWNVTRDWDEWAKTLHGGQGSFATLDDAIRLHVLIDAIKKSAEQGVKVDIEL